MMKLDRRRAAGRTAALTMALILLFSTGAQAASASAQSVAKTSKTTASVTSKRISNDPNTLEYGDSGDKVTKLQTALHTVGCYSGTIDGKFGVGTKRAIMKFQGANKLNVDGLAGTKTQELLYKKADAASASSSGSTSSSSSTGSTSSSSSTSSGFTRTMRKGCTGDDVKAVQKQLKALGYYNSTQDGSYGAVTVAAVSAFQKKNKLSVDGTVGSKTYARMFSSSAVNTTGSTGSTGSDTSSSSTSGDSASTTYTSLSYGDTGDAVKKLQKALKALKYNVVVDGNYGALTKMAITAFQKLNSLTVDGVASVATQKKLYGGSAVAYNSSVDQTITIDDTTGVATGPSVSDVKCLYWFTEVKPTIKSGQHITVFDPATKLEWTLRLYSLGHHADSEPLTATDTAIMFKAFGNTNTWTPKPVYVQLPSGVWTLASMHNVPHLNGSISDNNFDGHLCVHFLRTIAECTADDPDYGMQHQQAIRKKWKQMTGLDIAD